MKNKIEVQIGASFGRDQTSAAWVALTIGGATEQMSAAVATSLAEALLSAARKLPAVVHAMGEPV